MYPNYGLGFFCGLFGKSRQAFYEQNTFTGDRQLESAIILQLVREIRLELPKIGTRKLYFLLTKQLKNHQIKIGRDKFFDLLRDHGYLLRIRKRKPYTTNSNHPYRKYPNLIRDMRLTKPNQLWVSDITYIRLGNNKFAYLCIITDAYSRKIVGYCLSKTLHSQGVITAFNQAINEVKRTGILIHHSDRGVQYCCKEYVSLLEQNKVAISMTENGDPYENAIAERINGILKTEFGLGQNFSSFEEALISTDQAVSKYNSKRPHSSCDYLTPLQAHQGEGKLKSRWKKRDKNSAKVNVE